MKPKMPELTEHDPFRLELVNMINLRHELVPTSQGLMIMSLKGASEKLLSNGVGLVIAGFTVC